MNERTRRKGKSQSSADGTRRQFLSTVVAGAVASACGGDGDKPGGPGVAPDPGPRGPDPRSMRSGGAGGGEPIGGAAPPPAGTPAPAAEPAPAPAPPSGKRLASDRVMLGSTGIEVSRLVMGSGTHGSGGSSSQTKLGIPGFAKLLVQSYHEQKITFWETADSYGAHPHLKEAIRQVGRQNLVILTKSHARTAAAMQADLDRFRMELGIEQIDIVLLHAIESSTWTEGLAGAMDALSAAKQKGIIRAHGISCHSIGALRLAARTPWVDVDLARINPASLHMDADPATVISVLRTMKAAGKGVVGMKIIGNGQLANRLETAINHAVRLDAIDAFTIGFTSYAQLQDVSTRISQVAL